MLLLDDRLDTRRVRYFMQVLESGSVRGAADVLDMDPSAVSRSIAVLEKDCCARLLMRHGRGVVATEAGLLLASYARGQHDQKLQLLAELDSIEKIARGHIDIVVGEGFVEPLMRYSLRRFMEEYPDITVNLDTGSTNDIVRRIVDESAQIGVVFQPPEDPRLCSHYTHPEPIEAHVIETHPLAQLQGPLELADLLPYAGAALHTAFGVRQHIEAAELSEGIRLRSILTTTSFVALGHYVTAGLGYALCMRIKGWQELTDKRIVSLPMKNPLLSHGKLRVVSRQGHALSPAAARLMRIIVADGRRLADHLWI